MTNESNLSPIIRPETLLSHALNEFVIIDARSGKEAKANYLKQHLKGALFIDLETQLADIKEDAANGGRHPLPAPAQFSATLTSLGISKNSHVLIYDDFFGANAAARFWWMLRAAGHEKVQVLDGGWKAAIKVSFPMSSGAKKTPQVEPYTFEQWQLPQVNMAGVEQRLNDGEIVIDVRDPKRYQGITEPIDLIAGHIPGAINIPLTDNLEEDGFFKSPEKLRSLYQGQLKGINSKKITVHCGSGVTACHTLLAFDVAGFDIPNLYVGSWSEWSRNEKPTATS